MEHVQDTNEGGASARGRRLGWRICLRKGCGQRFQARRPNQRYCREPECLKALRRWQAAKRQQKRRATPEGRRQHAEAERQRRQRKASEAETPQEGQAPAAASEPVRGHAARKHPAVFCDRPGCYEAVRESSCAPASYCGDDCRTAMNRVRDRERKWLLRKRLAGRIKRRLEYQAARRPTLLRRRCSRQFGSRISRAAVPALVLCGRTFWVGERFAARLQGFSGVESP